MMRRRVSTKIEKCKRVVSAAVLASGLATAGCASIFPKTDTKARCSEAQRSDEEGVYELAQERIENLLYVTGSDIIRSREELIKKGSIELYVEIHANEDRSLKIQKLECLEDCHIPYEIREAADQAMKGLVLPECYSRPATGFNVTVTN